ncbi:MAG TPA: 23S rRNA (adenine(2030)-N(6))-methyltransferase RlmJ [Burkholderiales bacterium]|nr:23S rRNA (adenine(2030)-N(6))-methyltransferase RlmJ [Burkholderiales bacterium]
MLAYRHLFHAGNFADVFKHALLARLLLALGKKEKPLCYLDTHAGVGLYDLAHSWAAKNAEFRDGIGRLWERDDVPDLLAPYLDAVRAENRGGALRFYPGSPRIAQRLLRPTDRLLLSELNKNDCAALAERCAADRRVTVHLMDGYQSLKAHLPPPERRGLVLVDSSFDRAGEFKRLTDALTAAHERWATGVYAVWYPLMEQPTAMRAFERGVVASGIRKILQLELAVQPEGWTPGMRGCGMLVVNPPFGFDEEARTIVEWLWRALALDGHGGQRVRWLVPE